MVKNTDLSIWNFFWWYNLRGIPFFIKHLGSLERSKNRPLNLSTQSIAMLQVHWRPIVMFIYNCYRDKTIEIWYMNYHIAGSWKTAMSVREFVKTIFFVREFVKMKNFVRPLWWGLIYSISNLTANFDPRIPVFMRTISKRIIWYLAETWNSSENHCKAHLFPASPLPPLP